MLKSKKSKQYLQGVSDIKAILYKTVRFEGEIQRTFRIGWFEETFGVKWDEKWSYIFDRIMKGNSIGDIKETLRDEDRFDKLIKELKI